MPNENKIRELAKAYADQAGSFLEEKFPTASGREASSFYAQATARMIADMFALEYLDAGPEAGEAFLRHTLSMISSSVRLKRVPVMPIFTMELREAGKLSLVDSETASVETPAAAAPEKCVCVLDKGRCAKCVEILAEEYRLFSEGLFSRLKTAGHIVEAFLSNTKACSFCFPAMSDQAIASLVREWLPKLAGRPELVPMLAGGLLEVACLGGLADAPHTKSEIQRITEKLGS